MAKAIEVPRDIFEHMRTAVTPSDSLCANVMPKVRFLRKSLQIRVVGAEGLEPTTYSV